MLQIFFLTIILKCSFWLFYVWDNKIQQRGPAAKNYKVMEKLPILLALAVTLIRLLEDAGKKFQAVGKMKWVIPQSCRPKAGTITRTKGKKIAMFWYREY